MLGHGKGATTDSKQKEGTMAKKETARQMEKAMEKKTAREMAKAVEKTLRSVWKNWLSAEKK